MHSIQRAAFSHIDDPPPNLIVCLCLCRVELDRGGILQFDNQNRLILQTDFKANIEIGSRISRCRLEVLLWDDGKVGVGTRREVIVEQFIVLLGPWKSDSLQLVGTAEIDEEPFQATLLRW
jgi:hypothetical protein